MTLPPARPTLTPSTGSSAKPLPSPSPHPPYDPGATHNPERRPPSCKERSPVCLDNNQIPGYQTLDVHFRRLISAAARWCARADPGITPTIPRAAGPRTVHAIARWLVSQPGTGNWIYRGHEDIAGTHLVTVEMPDHSRRVLRDRDVRTGDLRWGYTGTGAHDLSSVLLADILDCHRECPDCFGVIPLAAGNIRCRSCGTSGMRPGTTQAEGELLIKAIDGLPEKFERTRLELLRTMAKT
jgi:hypothetical protein